jgi:hypothetical protein
VLKASAAAPLGKMIGNRSVEVGRWGNKVVGFNPEKR